MFDPSLSTHDEAVTHAREVAARFVPLEIAHAFAASLTRRRVEYRSALGSFAFARVLPEHSALQLPGPGLWCGVCGEHIADEHIDWNVLNFERIKWGGVRHELPSYMAFDLTLFGQLTELTPTAGDWDTLRRIVKLAASQAPTARPTDLERALGKVLRSNKAERRVLLQILGYAGILQSRDTSPVLNRFVPCAERATHTEWSYPMAEWRGQDGVNQRALAFWFPEIAGENP